MGSGADAPRYVLVVRHLVDYAQVRKYTPEHVAYLDRNHATGTFIAFGHPDAIGEGGVILARGLDRQELESVIQEDPYLCHGVSAYQIYTLYPRNPPVASAALPRVGDPGQ
jgi:uncharacterized protein YciI